MTDQRELELVSASLDGELDAEEQKELDALLESSSEARELQSEFAQLDSLLSEVPDVQPPASLHAQIMAQNNQPGAKPSVEKNSSLVGMLGDLVPGSGLRYVLATGAGAIIALLVVSVQPIDSNAIDYSDLVGTMSPNAGTNVADVLDSYEFASEGVESVVQLRLSEGLVFIDITTDSSQPLNISADFSSAGLWPDAVAQIQGRSESLAIAGQAVQIQTSGRQQLTILLHRADATEVATDAEISLEFSSEGELLDRGGLKAAW